VTRFSRELADLELPELLRALDPHLAAVPVLVRGEPGTGRGTLVRYLHHLGGTGDGALAHVACGPETDLDEIERVLFSLGRAHPRLPSVTVWFDEIGRLSSRAQPSWRSGSSRARRPVCGPRRCAGSRRSTRPAPNSNPRSRVELGTIEIALPALRDRGERAEAIALDIAAAWGARAARRRAASTPRRSRSCASTRGPATCASSRP
jgi:hypothetical protein